MSDTFSWNNIRDFGTHRIAIAEHDKLMAHLEAYKDKHYPLFLNDVHSWDGACIMCETSDIPEIIRHLYMTEGAHSRYFDTYDRLGLHMITVCLEWYHLDHFTVYDFKDGCFIARPKASHVKRYIEEAQEEIDKFRRWEGIVLWSERVIVASIMLLDFNEMSPQDCEVTFRRWCTYMYKCCEAHREDESGTMYQRMSESACERRYRLLFHDNERDVGRFYFLYCRAYCILMSPSERNEFYANEHDLDPIKDKDKGSFRQAYEEAWKQKMVQILNDQGSYNWYDLFELLCLPYNDRIGDFYEEIVSLAKSEK